MNVKSLSRMLFLVSTLAMTQSIYAHNTMTALEGNLEDVAQTLHQEKSWLHLDGGLTTSFNNLLKEQSIKTLKLSPTMKDAVEFAQHNFNSVTALYSAWVHLKRFNAKVESLLLKVKKALVQASNETAAKNYSLLAEALDFCTKTSKKYMQHLADHKNFENQKKIYKKSAAYQNVCEERERLA